MEPTLQDGNIIMVDHQRVALVHKHIFAVHTSDGLLVRRAVRSGRKWRLVSENPKHKPTALPRDAQVIGQVVWAGRTLCVCGGHHE